ILLVVIAGLIVARRRASASWHGAIAVAAAGLAWAVLMVAPSSIAVFSEAAVADRYAYLPLFGFAVAGVALGARAARESRALRLGLGGLIAAFLGLCVFVTAREIPVWATSGALYVHAVEVEP